MRFTVKAKLASAFGIVILLFIVAGVVSYVKLSDMVGTAESLVSRANRMEKAAELEKGILAQVRAEKNAILASSDAEHAQFTTELAKLRDSVLKSKDEIYAVATETGKKMMDSFASAYTKMNAYQDETVRLAKTDKANATDRSMHEGRKVVAEAMESANAYIEYVKKAMADQAEQARQDGARAEMLLMSLVIASLLIAAVAATWIAINISRGLASAVGLADAVAIGDLSQKINASSNDEIGDLIKSLNAMTVNLNATAAVAFRFTVIAFSD